MRTLITVILLLLAGTGWWLAQPSEASGVDAALSRMADREAAGADRAPAAEAVDASVESSVAEPTLQEDLALVAELEHVVNRPALQSLERRLARALTDDKDNPALNEALCTTARLLGDAEAAVAFGDRAVALQPESSEAHLAYAKALAELMRVKGVFSAMKHVGTYKELIKRAIELDPGNVQARVARIGFLVFAPGLVGGDLEQAKRLAEELRPVDARYSGLMSALALAQEEMFDAALDVCEASLEQFPGDQALHLSMARMLDELGRDEEAAAHYDAVLMGDKTEKYYQALYHRAVLRLLSETQMELVSAAMAEYAAADPYGDFLPTVAEALWRQGQACQWLGRPEEARVCYEAALESDPELDDARVALAALD